MADSIKKIGKFEIWFDDEATDLLKISYGGTALLTINSSNAGLTAGAADGNPDGPVYGTVLYGETGANFGSLSSGMAVLNVTGDSGLAGPLSVTGTSSFIQFPVLTSTQRDALTPAAGMVIYNSSDTKLQCYAGGVWNNLF